MTQPQLSLPCCKKQKSRISSSVCWSPFSYHVLLSTNQTPVTEGAATASLSEKTAKSFLPQATGVILSMKKYSYLKNSGMSFPLAEVRSPPTEHAPTIHTAIPVWGQKHCALHSCHQHSANQQQAFSFHPAFTQKPVVSSYKSPLRLREL